MSRGRELYDSGRNRVERWMMRHRILGAIYGFTRRLFRDNIVGLAAQTAFFLLLAIFPILLVCAGWVSRLNLNFDAGILSAIFPESVVGTIMPILENPPDSMGFTVVQLVLAVWSASSGIWALMRGICISHTGRSPSFFKGRLLSMLLMVGFVVMLALSMTVWVFGHETALLVSGGRLHESETAVTIARYAFTLPLLFLFVLIVYAATPGFEVKKRNMVLGAMFAAVGWTLVSWVFEIYIESFSSYSVLYGGVGAFLGLAVWLLAISFVILLGAELNALLVEVAAARRHNDLTEDTDN